MIYIQLKLFACTDGSVAPHTVLRHPSRQRTRGCLCPEPPSLPLPVGSRSFLYPFRPSLSVSQHTFAECPVPCAGWRGQRRGAGRGVNWNSRSRAGHGRGGVGWDGSHRRGPLPAGSSSQLELEGWAGISWVKGHLTEVSNMEGAPGCGMWLGRARALLGREEMRTLS